MKPFHASRAVCLAVGLFASFAAPVIADEKESEMPIVLAAMVAAMSGWLMFDHEIRKARRETDSGE